MSQKELTHFDTPLPGQLVESTTAEKIVADFRQRFRIADSARIPSNVPTACLLQGDKATNVFQSQKFLEKDRIFFYLESASLLYLAEPQTILHYLAGRQPWEDYDICLFDESLEWCVGITHNDDVIVSDTKGALD